MINEDGGLAEPLDGEPLEPRGEQLFEVPGIRGLHDAGVLEEYCHWPTHFDELARVYQSRAGRAAPRRIRSIRMQR